MSHIVTIKTKVRDAAAISAACRRLDLAAPVHGATDLFSGPATGWAVQLPDWKYPIVCDVESSQINYDNFNGSWKGQT